ncbi:magnesium transporter CorA family protein [Gemmobacter fulvus]|uniref:magnesium transporter CorA family protein n=1 Tax=Gemmobacter fulvus TaxID=2840474 RepID=UPI0035205E43
MLLAYRAEGGRMLPGASVQTAQWIDLVTPDAEEAAQVAALGLEVPSLADMEEIELSNRLYHEGGAHYMTVVMSGQRADGARITGPVTFILSPERLVTVRHHTPRPFDTYPPRAGKMGAGCGTPAAVFLGLIEEIIGRQADHLEETGRGLDTVTTTIYTADPTRRTPERLQVTLQRVGREGEMLGKVRLALMTLARAVSFFQQLPAAADHTALVAGLQRDMQALEVHADFLASRVALASDATLGMIDLDQNTTVRIVSVVAVLFLPPTLIASIYGMNFAHMPELAQSWGYPAALLAMVASAVLTWTYFKWRRWL